MIRSSSHTQGGWCFHWFCSQFWGSDIQCYPCCCDPRAMVACCLLCQLGREKSQPASAGNEPLGLPQACLDQDATKQVYFSLRRPLVSHRVWSNLVCLESCQTVCGANQRAVLHFLSCISEIAFSKHTNIAFVSVTDTVLPTPLNTPGVVSVIFFFFLLELPATSVTKQKPKRKSAFTCQLPCANDLPLSITFH